MVSARPVRRWSGFCRGNFFRSGSLGVLLLLGVLSAGATDLPVDAESLSLDSLLAIPVQAAAKYAQSTGDAPASVTILTAEQIYRFGWRTLTDALEAVRGFYHSDDRNYQLFGMRGFLRTTDYNNRILMLLNGHTLNEQMQGQAPLGSLFTLDMRSVDHIEIVRGPGSALYGTGAMFALINIVTKTGADPEGVRAAVEGFSPGGVAGGLSYSQAFAHGWNLQVSARALRDDGGELFLAPYDQEEFNYGRVKGLDWEASGGSFALLTGPHWRMQSYWMTRHKGIPTAAWGVSFGDRLAHTEDSYRGLEAEWQGAVSPHLKLALRGYSDEFLFDGTYPYDDPEPDNNEETHERRFGGEVRGEATPCAANRLVAGVEGVRHYEMHYWSRNGDVIFANESHPFTDLSLFAQDEHRFTHDLILTAGLRQSWYSQGFQAAVPRAALVYHPHRTSALKLLYGEAFRAPQLSESYYIFPGQAKESRGLRPERIRTLEVVGEQQFLPPLSGTISLYQFAVTGLIDNVLDPADSLTYYRNHSGANGRGVELELVYQPAHGPGGYASATWQRATDKGDGELLSNSPAWLWKGGLSLPLHRYVYGALEGQYQTSRYTLLRTRSAPFALWNLTLTSRHTLEPLRLSLQVKNLFDHRYGTPGSWEQLLPTALADLPVVPARGRTVSMRVECAF